MKTMSMMEAIREAMNKRMREDNNVLLFGEDVGAFGGCFGVSAGMFDEFGPDRVRDTPISEGAIIGTAVGAAATGLRPIAELMFIDFVTVGADQLVNQAAKMRYMFGGKITLPMVVRLPLGAGISAAAQHSQSLEAWMAHVPGLKVVYPSTPADAYGLLLKVDENMAPIEFGVGDVKREGGDVTIVATGKMVHEALAAAEKLSADGIEAEVFDPRTLFPFDKEGLLKSLEKTNKVVIATEENKRGSFAGEISAIIAEDGFDYLDGPVLRVCAMNTPVPFSPVLEQYYVPSADDIVTAVKKMF
jgi:pyruvate dehydrogenase E1 component beta subunit